MHTDKNVLKFLDNINIDHGLINHPAVFTVAESKGILEVNHPIKNLLLENRNASKYFMVIMPGNERLDLKRLAIQLHETRLSFTSPSTMMQLLGVTPGSVSLFGLLHPGSEAVEVIIESSLINADKIGFHPNDNTATVFIAGSAMEKILKHTGHVYKIISLH